MAGVAALYLEQNVAASAWTVRDAMYAATTKGIVTSSKTADNHLLYSLLTESETVGNTAPTASFTYQCSDLGCTFDGSGSGDSDGSIASYAWNYGDAAPAPARTRATPTSLPAPTRSRSQ